jgi:hypothetical protein
MRNRHAGQFVAFLTLSIAAAIGCGKGSAKGFDETNDLNNLGPGGGTAGTGGSGNNDPILAGGSDGGPAACVTFSGVAKQLPAAMLIVLDASASMTTTVSGGQPAIISKWGAAQQAVVGAIDEGVFDSMSLGLVTFPSSFVDPPACLCNHIGQQLGMGDLDTATCKSMLSLGGGSSQGVSCGVATLPQVPISQAGGKSNSSSGARRDIYNFLSTHQPLSNGEDGSPIYAALESGYAALKAYATDRRLLVLITDGGFSCTSVSGRDGYADSNTCPDWENPDAVNTLITKARTDGNKPIQTFVIGVPGSDSNGARQGSFDTAPYDMRLALSTYAVNGSPDTLDPACEKATTYTQNGASPAKPCHFDLTRGAFGTDVLANAIAQIRGKALGCVYDLPTAPTGETIDREKVNVSVAVGADAAITVKKRANGSDTCSTDGCWDFNSAGQVEILGKSCSDVIAAREAKVDVYFGCKTLVK